jgi:hypothetical protein
MENNSSNRGPLLYSRLVRSFEQPKMVKWLLEEGWVRSDREAMRVLILIAIICVSVSFIFIYNANPSSGYKNFSRLSGAANLMNAGVPCESQSGNATGAFNYNR